MSLQISDNFNYRGKQPNFARDQFATVSAMASYSEVNIPEGHVAYCVETGRRYEWKSGNTVDPTLHRWRLLSDLQLSQQFGNSTEIGMSQNKVTQEFYKRPTSNAMGELEAVELGGKVLDYAGDSTIDAISQRFATVTDTEANVHAEDTSIKVEAVEESLLTNALRKTQQTLTDAEKQQVYENLDIPSNAEFDEANVHAETTEQTIVAMEEQWPQMVLRKTAQTLTETEKQQVRTNIGAATAADIQNVANAVVCVWQGSVAATRLTVATDLRKQCLEIRYFDGTHLCCECYIGVDYYDSAWQNDANWQNLLASPAGTQIDLDVTENAEAVADA